MSLYSELTAYAHHKPLQENNAIAEISLDQEIVTGVAPLPKKSWDSFALDASDKDGGIYQYEPNRNWHFFHQSILEKYHCSWYDFGCCCFVFCCLFV